MIAIIDYGAGNVESVRHALERLGEDSQLTTDREAILSADGVILPGVGAFGEAMRQLEQRGLIDTLRRVREMQKPFLGICIGLQLLFESSEESPGAKGLAFLPGRVVRIHAEPGIKVPHMGWNQPRLLAADDPLFSGLPDTPWFYFVHSFYAHCEKVDAVTAQVRLGSDAMDVALRDGNLYAVQFHPEKSGAAGLALLKNFCGLCERGE